MSDSFLGKAAPLSQAAFDDALGRLEVDPPSLWALLAVETRGFGFLPDRRPKILFERHVFHKRTDGRFGASQPDISGPERGGYKGGAQEYGRLARAIQLDRKAALESASWGLAQIMGYNAAPLRYVSADEMIARFLEGEDAQLDGAVRFITANPALGDAFRKKKWSAVAFYYNGKAYAEHGYHLKLDRCCELYAIKGTPSLEVRAAQARLAYLGFDPQGVDGVFGNGTRAAVLAFQRARGLPLTADLDGGTLQHLGEAANV